MISWHTPGQMVVCIDPVKHHRSNMRCEGFLERGAIYTIREVVCWKEQIGFLLGEIVLPLDERFDMEPPFKACRFRPVDKTSIEPFRALLRQISDRVKEDA